MMTSGHLTLVWWVSRMAMIIRGMAHAVAFTYRGWKKEKVMGWGGAAIEKEGGVSYRVGVVQAAIFLLIQDIEASALIVRAVGCTGDLPLGGDCMWFIQYVCDTNAFKENEDEVFGSRSSCSNQILDSFKYWEFYERFKIFHQIWLEPPLALFISLKYNIIKYLLYFSAFFWKTETFHNIELALQNPWTWLRT